MWSVFGWVTTQELEVNHFEFHDGWKNGGDMNAIIYVYEWCSELSYECHTPVFLKLWVGTH